ncbi:unnamed protein product [Victoria cruziana]
MQKVSEAALFVLLLVALHSAVRCSYVHEGFCSSASLLAAPFENPLYAKVVTPTLSPLHLQDLPGFTRSVYRSDHAVITPESHVFSPLPDWKNTLGAYLITPATGAHFVMYLAKMTENSESALPAKDVERFVFVLQGNIMLTNGSGMRHVLDVDAYAYLPANYVHFFTCDTSAFVVVFERRYDYLENHSPEIVVSSTQEQKLLETPGEVFELRKLLPTTAAYDFNIHVRHLDISYL